VPHGEALRAAGGNHERRSRPVSLLRRPGAPSCNEVYLFSFWYRRCPALHQPAPKIRSAPRLKVNRTVRTRSPTFPKQNHRCSTDVVWRRSSSSTRFGSRNASVASSKETPCFSSFATFFLGSHSNRYPINTSRRGRSQPCLRNRAGTPSRALSIQAPLRTSTTRRARCGAD
jgi:hypothetical protein